jgi:hypothetical protein
MRYAAGCKGVKEVGKADGGVTFVDRVTGHEVLRLRTEVVADRGTSGSVHSYCGL